MRPRELSPDVVAPRIRAIAAIVLAAFGLILTLAAPALAHAELESSTPADGAASAQPLDRVELVFTEGVVPVSGRMRLLGESGLLRITVFQPSPDTAVIEPAVPLLDGNYGLLWAVESADGHRVGGTISFTVGVDGATDDEDAPSTGNGAAPGGDLPETAVGPTTTLPMLSESLPARVVETAPVAITVPGSPAGEWAAWIGRWALMAGALLAIGALAFAGTSLIGSEEEVRMAVRWVRRGGVLVLIGTLVEVVGVVATRAGFSMDAMARAALVDLLASSYGVAVLLRLAGGIALLQDPRLAATHAIRPASDDPGPAVTDRPAEPGVAIKMARPMDRFRLEVRQEWVAMAGVAAVAASFLFDGHTASVEHLTIARAASLAHVLAGGVWLGGLVVMAATLTRRFRGGAPLEAAAMAVRFSRVAAVALIVAAVAGLALTWTIIDSPADLLSGAWGRLLLIKVALVVVATMLGGYNHFKVVPALDQRSANAEVSKAEVSDRFRRIVRTETMMLVAVVAITAILVNAAP